MSPRRLYSASLSLTVLVLTIILRLPGAEASQPETRDGTADAALRGYFSANGLLNRGLYELAAAEYETFLLEHGDHEKAPVARYGLAVCLFRMKQYENAVVELDRLRQVPEFSYAAEVATMLGRCHLAIQQHERAAEVFAVVVEKHGEHDLADDAAAGLIEALYIGDKFDEAISRCRAFVSHQPDSPLRERAEFFGGLAEMGRKDYPAAAQRFADLLERFPKGRFTEQATLRLAQCHHHGNAVEHAVRAYRRVLKQGGGQYLPDALLGLATLQYEQGDYADAGVLLDQLLKEFPDSALAASAKLYRGRVWFEQERFDRAFEAFEQVVGQKGDLKDDAAYWMAKCKLREGDLIDAGARLERAIGEFPQSDLLPEMCYDRGIALLRAGKHRAAIRALEELRSRFPKHALSADALYLLAATEHQQRHYDQSRAYCDSFLDQYPSHESAVAVSFLSAENEYLAERYAEAADAFRRFISKHPQNEQAQKAKYRLGTALYRMERLDEAGPLLAEIAGEAGEDPVLRSSLLALGDVHFQRGEWKQAQRRLSEYVSAGLDVPLADDALIKLGLAHQRQGQNEEALRAYDRLIEQFPDSPHRLQAVFERGQALIALGKSDAAAGAFKLVLHEEGSDRFAPYALNHLAAIALERKDFDAAAEYFGRVQQEEPSAEMAERALLQRGEALMASERLKDAEEAFSRFLRQYPSHERAGRACAQLAVALARQDRYEDALKTIDHLEREFADTLDPALRASVQYEKAWCLRESDRPDAAADSYRTLLDQGPAGGLHVHALLELAGMEEQAGRHESAAQLLRQLRRRITSSPEAVSRNVQEQATYRLAVCEFELEDFQEAAELFEEFTASFPKSPLAASAGFFCGESLFKTGRHERAVVHLGRVVEQFPTDPVIGPSLLRLGECLAALQRWARSEQVFTEYIERFGDSKQSFQAHFNIGWARENQKRYDEAIRAYRQVISRHDGPTAARAQFQIGECLFARKQYEEAARELLKVDILYSYPEWSAGALYEAGRCFERLGKPVEARAQFKTVTDKHKATRWARMASDRLAKVSGGHLPGRTVKDGN